MNFVFDHISDQHIDDFGEFVQQINGPGLLDLFVSGLCDEVTELPFKPKPRIVKTDAPTKRAVVMDKKDKQVATLFNEVNLLSKDKTKKQKQKQRAQKQMSFFRRKDQSERPR
ncbi:hypothetical protein EV178_005367 [Coemansia sp. RSA 1646]|nr:hypothetical protein EV178_005367 [Coemansia sp. RSA 1646]